MSVTQWYKYKLSLLIDFIQLIQQNENDRHIDAVDMDKVRVCVEDTHVWMNNMQNYQERLAPDQEPAIHSTQIQTKIQVRRNFSNPNMFCCGIWDFICSQCRVLNLFFISVSSKVYLLNFIYKYIVTVI